MDLALNNLQRLIRHKKQTEKSWLKFSVISRSLKYKSCQISDIYYVQPVDTGKYSISSSVTTNLI